MTKVKQEWFNDKSSYRNFLLMAEDLKDFKEKVSRLEAEGRDIVILDSYYNLVDLDECKVIINGTDSRIMNDRVIYAGDTHDSKGKLYVSSGDYLMFTRCLNIYEKL